MGSRIGMALLGLSILSYIAGIVVLIVLLATLFTVLFCHFAQPRKSRFSYQGKTIIVTGGSQGIGLSIAKQLATQGAHIVLVARNISKLTEAKHAVKECAKNKDQRIKIVSCDLGLSEITVREKFSECVELSKVDCLINCAGYAILNYTEKLTEGDYRRMMEVNYLGSVFATRALLPEMQTRRSGQIVFLSSQGGQVGFIGMTAYSPSKYAIRGFAECLRNELLPFDISVSIVYPPDTDTPGYAVENVSKPVECKEISETSNLSSPDDVARTIISQIATGSFSVPVGFDGFYLDSVSAGLTPYPGIFKAICQIWLGGILRLVGIFYSHMFDRIVLKHQDKRLKAT